MFLAVSFEIWRAIGIEKSVAMAVVVRIVGRLFSVRSVI